MKRYTVAILTACLFATPAAFAPLSPATADGEPVGSGATPLDELAPPDAPDGDPAEFRGGPERPVTGLTPTEADELAAEAAAYASDYGLTPAAASARLQEQSTLSGLASEVQTLVDPDRLAGISLSHETEPKLMVRLTAGPVPSVLENLESDGLVVTTNAAMSLTERTEAANSLSQEWDDSIPSLDSWFIDEASERVVLLVTDDVDIERTRRMVRTGQLDLTAGRDNIELDLAIEKTVPLSLENKGGRDLRSCTSGFVVKQAGERPGFLTAGHCTPPQPWFFFGGGNGQPTFVVGRSHNSYRDMGFYRISPRQNRQVRPFVYRASTTGEGIRQRRNVGNVQGDYVCRRGKTTGFSCGTIESVRSTLADCNGQQCEPRWVAVRGPNLRSAGGDSGGPWFAGLSPVGVHNGSNFASGGDRATYSKLGNMPSGMSIWVG